jgi:isocitrate dehydrogenase
MENPARITIKGNGGLNVPDWLTIPFIEGDGVGPDIWHAARRVIDSALEAEYDGRKKIFWLEVYAGEKGYKKTGDWLPESTLETIKKHAISLKGPLATPVGKGIRSINVALRRELDLYACIRPIKHIDSVPSPVKHPERVDMVIFRENTEDVYAGIEWSAASLGAKTVRSFLKERMGIFLPADAGIGIKPISEKKTKMLVAKAISYAIQNKLPSVTLVHKGNIMKFTEGAFRNWGYEVAKQVFGAQTITEKESVDGGERPTEKVVIKDRIADMMFQEVLLRPEQYHVIATPNLNGDYLSDAIAAQVGGLGMAPGANIGEMCAVFEPTHGTAPLLAGQDTANPSSLILSAAMMLDYIGWPEASKLIRRALEFTVKKKTVTWDLARQIKGVQGVTCSHFANAMIENFSCIEKD